MIEIIGTELYQWDTGRSVSVTGASHAHFANKGDSQAPIIEVTDGQAKIPDYLLQTGKQLCVYAVNDGVTIETKVFSVKKRERPENYIYDEDHRNYIYQIITDSENAVAEANRVTKELLTAKENGDFDGYTPQKGVDYYTPEEKAELVKEISTTVTGDIETALDGIIAIQNSLIGGDGE